MQVAITLASRSGTTMPLEQMSIELSASVKYLRSYTGQTAVEVQRILSKKFSTIMSYIGPQYVPTYLIVTQAWLACDEMLKVTCGQVEHIGKRNTY
jgi:hypothetical protein